MKFKLILVVFFITSNSFGCINEYRTQLSGERIYRNVSDEDEWEKKVNKVKLRKEAKALFDGFKRTDSIEYLSDYAAHLIYLGEYKIAKEIYIKIEEEKPNLYTTASNLGTIYELIGKPDSALIWIKKSVNLNPEAHDNSEWIHIKILEFKISKSKNVQNSILGLDFGNGNLPQNLEKYNLNELEDEIKHQLSERTVFIKPKDWIVGNIFFDLGNILAQTTDLQIALKSYASAKKYGFQSKLMESRVENLESIIWRAQAKDNIIFFGGLIVFSGIISYMSYKFIKKLKKSMH